MVVKTVHGGGSALPVDQRGAPREAGTEGHQAQEVASGQTPVTHGLREGAPRPVGITCRELEFADAAQRITPPLDVFALLDEPLEMAQAKVLDAVRQAMA